MKSTPSWLKLLIKISVTAICLWYVIRKIDWQQSLQTFHRSNWLWLFLALLLLTASKLAASFRLNIYFRNINVRLSQKSNLQLYWLGMFYNLFLPGGIGGDAYKVIMLNRRFRYPVKMLAAGVFLDRVTGVAGIGILGILYYYFVFGGAYYSFWLLLLLIPCMLLYYFIVQKFFPSFLPGFWPTFGMGLAVQALQVVCVYSIMNALHLHEAQTAYILIFLLSSLVAVLPFTIGGLGAREIVFIWGSYQFLLNKDQSVCISLLFYLLSVIISIVGIYWVYKNPLEEKGSDNSLPGISMADEKNIPDA